MKNNLIKVRIAAHEKDVVNQAADDAEMSMSAFVRRATLAAIDGRLLSRPILADSRHMRTLANDLAAMANNEKADLEAIVAAVKSIAGEIHAIATRQLERVRS